jgi:hypothetical protein
MTNLYHILYQEPIYNLDQIQKGHEELALQLVKAGLLRIDAYNKINFARFSVPSKGINRMFSIRELYDKDLLLRTKKIIREYLKSQFSSSELVNQVKNHISFMRNELTRYQYIDEELELKIARIIVQSAHPSIIHLILLEKVEVFVSYAHNIGDMLDTYSWQTAGSNNGMQSIEGNNAAIFVSAGGDPFGKTENLYYGDGKPALARMIVIAAQEIGHYSDFLRDEKGRKVSRFSMNFDGYGARDPVKTYRLQDIQHVKTLIHTITRESFLFKSLYNYEGALKFFRQNRKGDLIILITSLKILFQKLFVKLFLGRKYKILFEQFSRYDYLALKIVEMLEDMEFNLTPQADVYRNPDKRIEEAIQCAEALARVPQQTMKWGEKVTRYVYPNLFKFYYKTVIPYNIKVLETFTNTRFTFNTTRLKVPFYKKIFYFFSKKK